MLLQGDLTLGDFGKIAEHRVPEFTTRDHFVPFLAAYLTFIGFYSIKPEGKMAFILQDPHLVPFPDRITEVQASIMTLSVAVSSMQRAKSLSCGCAAAAPARSGAATTTEIQRACRIMLTCQDAQL